MKGKFGRVLGDLYKGKSAQPRAQKVLVALLWWQQSKLRAKQYGK